MADASNPPRNANFQTSGDADHLEHDGSRRDTLTARHRDIARPDSRLYATTHSKIDDEGRDYAACQARQGKGARVRKAAIAHVTTEHLSTPGVSNVITPDPECGSLPLTTQDDLRDRQSSSVTEAHSCRKNDARHVETRQHDRKPFIYVNSNHPQRVVKMRCPRGREQLIGRLQSKPCPDPDHSASLSPPIRSQKHQRHPIHGLNEATTVGTKLRTSGNVNSPIEISSDSNGESDFNSSDTRSSHDVSSHCAVDTNRGPKSSRSLNSSNILERVSQKEPTISGQLDGIEGSKIPTHFQSGTPDGQNMSTICKDSSADKSASQCAPAITDEQDNSEDSDPPVRFSRKRRIRLHPGGKDRNLKGPDFRCRKVSPIESEGPDVQSYDSDAPLLLTIRQEIQRDSSTSSSAHARTSTSPERQVEIETEQQSSRLSTKRVAESILARIVSSKTVVGGGYVIKRPAVENTEPMILSQMSTPVLRQDIKHGGQECMSSHTMDEHEQPDPACRSATIIRTYKKSTFGIKDIVGKDEPPQEHVFSLDDVIPKKRTKPVKTSVCNENLRIFHTALRACFPPAIIGPDFIQCGPVKNKEFGFIDVIGTAKRDPLFSVEHAIERYKWERQRADDAGDFHRGSQPIESKEADLSHSSDDIMDYEPFEDT